MAASELADDVLTPESATGALIRKAWTRNAGPLKDSREEIIKCRDIQRGKLVRTHQLNPFPNDVPLQPERELLPLQASTRYGERRPFLHRKATRGSIVAGARADKLELWINAALEETLDWQAIIGKLVEDGEVGLIVQPSPTYAEQIPDFIWTVQGKRGVNPRYRRDRDGRREGKSGYKGLSVRRSLRAYVEANRERIAQRPPWLCRVISSTDCAPSFVHGRGKNRFEVASMVVRTLYSQDDLARRGYLWDGMGKLLIPRGFEDGNVYGESGMLWLYEYWGYTQDHEPWMAISVGGQDTRRSEEADERVITINLAEEYGMTKLPVGYFWGLHRESDDVGSRGIPYLKAFSEILLSIERKQAAIDAAVEENAFTGHIAKLPENPELLAPFLENGRPRPFEKPGYNEIKFAPGDVEPFAQARIGADAYQSLSIQQAIFHANAPAEEARGRSGSSGYQMSVAERLENLANRFIPEGGRLAIEFAGETLLELVCSLSQGGWRVAPEGVDVPLYVNFEGEPEPTGALQTTREQLEFDDAWVEASIYDLHAEYPPEPDLAGASLALDAYIKGAGTLERYLEKLGVTATQLEKGKIYIDQDMRDPESPLRRAMQAYALRIAGQEEAAKRIELQLQGELSPGGMPTSVLQAAQAQGALAPPGAPAPGAAPPAMGAPPGMPPPGGGVAGVGLPNIPASIRGGIVAGALQTGPQLQTQRALQQAMPAPNGQVG